MRSVLAGGVGVHAQVSESGYTLPMNLALQGALKAVQTCAASGYDVTATVVDVAGPPQVVLRGDHATIHTKDSAFRKAYTIVTIGPIFHIDTTSEFLALLSKYPPLAGQGACIDAECRRSPGRGGHQVS